MRFLRYNASLMPNTKTSKTKKTTVNATSTTIAAEEHDHHHDHAHDHSHVHDHSKESALAPNEKVTLTIAWADALKSYQKHLRLAAKNFKAEGFRQGKAPLALVEKQVGNEAIIEATLRELIPHLYETAVQAVAENKKPITMPEFHPVKLNKGEDWIVEAEYAAFPVIDVKNYKKAVANGNKTAAQFIKEREEALLKEAAAAKKEKKTSEPEAKPASTSEQPTPLTENEKNEIRLQHIFQALVSELKPTIPELLLRQETQAEFERLVEQLKQYQIKLEDYLARREITLEVLSNELASGVLGRLQVDFILASISQLEKLTVSEEKLEAAFQKITNLEVREKMRQDQNYTTQLKANLLQQVTLDFLLKL